MVQDYFDKFGRYILVSDYNLLKSMQFDFQTMNGYQVDNFEKRFISRMQELLEAREYDSILAEIEVYDHSWLELNPHSYDEIYMPNLSISANYWERV